MTFANYNTTNNAKWQLLSWISAGSTSFTLLTWQWALFPASNGIVTIEKISEWWIVTQREEIKYLTRSWDTFNCTWWRGFWTCPPSDTSLIPWNTPFIFDAWDYVSLYYTAEQDKDIRDELTRLETVKLDISTYDQEKIAYAASSAWDDDYEVTIPWIDSYIDWQTFKIKADVANSSSATLNINSLWALTLKKLKESAFVDLETDDIIATQIFFATYNSSSGGFFQFSVDPAQVIIPDIASTKSTFVAWENITAWNALYVSWSNVFKTDASNSSKINFIWFATNTVSTWWNVIVDTSWVSVTQSGLTIWSDYFLSTTSSVTVATRATDWSSISLWADSVKVSDFFTASATWFLDKITLNMYKIWSPTYWLTVKLMTVYNGVLLATSNAVAAASIPSSAWDVDFVFSNPVKVYSWINYYIIVEWDWTNNASNFYNITAQYVASWWTLFYYNWSTWSAITSRNLYIRATQNNYWTWIGWISTKPWLYSKYVWSAESSTQLKIKHTWIYWDFSLYATTGTIVLWNAVWYVTTNINWQTVKIPYFNV